VHTTLLITSAEYDASCVRNHKHFISSTVEIERHVNCVIYLHIVINIAE